MAKRKTVEIRTLVEKVNEKNQVSTCPAEIRTGWNAMLEMILSDAGVYAGFDYYEAKDLPAGQLPGIIWGKDGADNTFPDESRRFYYLHSSIR